MSIFYPSRVKRDSRGRGEGKEDNQCDTCKVALEEREREREREKKAQQPRKMLPKRERKHGAEVE